MCLCVCLRACQFAVNNSLSNMLCNQNKFPLTWTNKESYLILSYLVLMLLFFKQKL